ncbi:MAG: tRNA epoxyqueuosine(34) reductase QueG [Ignavibacteriaceae bacterium]
MNITNDIIIEKAKDQGFDLIGFAPADELNKEIKNLKKWLNKNYQAGMLYMERNIEKRKNVKNLLSSAKSVISLGLNYYTPEKYSNDKNKGKISRYAWGKDYHLIIWKKLYKLVDELKKIDSSFEAKSYVDTGPVMDKAWAVKSGIGWLGKHTNVINKEYGSWFFIASLITNFEFEYSLPMEDFCGSCRACIDACPTNAIIDEYVIDANKCISYLTIENKDEIPEQFNGKFENWIFGCDICQDVCPWNNKFSKITDIEEFFPVNDNKELSLNEAVSISKDEFNKKFKDSPVKRTKLSGLKRNAYFLS